MKEIGGYHELESFENKEFYNNLLALNLARNALLYVIRARRFNVLYLPYYLCGSVLRMLRKEEIETRFYCVNSDFTPIIEKRMLDNECILIVNYFGQLKNDYLAECKEKYGNIIVDNVQAFFQEPIDGIDTIYSCRKYFGVPDGAYLATSATYEKELEIDVSWKRASYLFGRYETGNASMYYDAFKANGAIFKELEIKKMSRLTHNLLGVINYQKVKLIREQNFLFLHEKLGNINKLRLSIPLGPYAYPILIDNGLNIKKQLAAQNIYVPTLWPDALASQDKIAREYSAEILPLPCDQRYDNYDMEEIVKQVEKCID